MPNNTVTDSTGKKNYELFENSQEVTKHLFWHLFISIGKLLWFISIISLAEGGIHNMLNVIQEFRNLNMLSACGQFSGSV